MLNYIHKWNKYMVNLKSAEQMRKQMGWTEDFNGFVIGSTEYRRDGTTKKTAASAFVLGVSKILNKSGEYEEWKKAANLINQQGLEIFSFFTLCGFGSPLMRLTSISGVSVCFTGASGSGKSGSLYCAASLFGEPKKLSLSGSKKTSATENALIQWMISLKNIMMPLDEASNRPPDEVSDLIHKVSDGKAKLRMQSSVDALRDIESSSSMISCLTSNQSLTAKLVSLKTNPDGELARLLDIKFKKPKPFLDDPTLAPKIIEPMRQNYGHAGPEYIQYLFKLGDAEVHRRVLEWQARFRKDFGDDTVYRFWDTLVAVAFAGGEIAVEAGIISWDLERIYNVILSELIELRDGPHKINDVDYESVLGSFQDHYQNGTIVVQNGLVTSEPKSSLVARIDGDALLYYVSTKVLDDYLRKSQLDPRAFVEHMKEKGILVDKVKKRLTDNWGGRSSTSPVHLYVFKGKMSDEIVSKYASRD